MWTEGICLKNKGIWLEDSKIKLQRRIIERK
jgi:hypothetical protein